MKKRILVSISALFFTIFFINYAFGAPNDVIEKEREIRQSLKQLHGKPFSEVEQYFFKNLDVSAPYKTSGRSVRYMIPITDPWCIKVNLRKHYKEDILASWETMPWFRNNPNSLSKECDRAFKER